MGSFILCRHLMASFWAEAIILHMCVCAYLTPPTSLLVHDESAARLCKPCTLKLHYFEKFLAQNLQHQAGSVQPGQPAALEPVAALMTGLHIADIYMVS